MATAKKPRKAQIPPADSCRFTTIIRKSTRARLHNYAYTERVTVQEAVDRLINECIDNYEKEHELLRDPKRKDD